MQIRWLYIPRDLICVAHWVATEALPASPIASWVASPPVKLSTLLVSLSL
ncbi:hypothetical protein LguiA_026364 [Lonicera macranthoides]